MREAISPSGGETPFGVLLGQDERRRAVALGLLGEEREVADRIRRYEGEPSHICIDASGGEKFHGCTIRRK